MDDSAQRFVGMGDGRPGPQDAGKVHARLDGGLPGELPQIETGDDPFEHDLSGEQDL